MIRFDAWPPEIGKIHFTDSAQKQIDELANLYHGPDGLEQHYYLTYIGGFVGSLLFANMEPRSQYNARETAMSLTRDWDPDAASAFRDGVNDAITKDTDMAGVKS